LLNRTSNYSDITEMVIEHYKDGKSSNNINIADKDVINQVTANLTSISVTKLSVDQEKSIMDNGNKLSLESTYIVHLRNKHGDTKTAFAILSDHELMLFDVKTMLGNTRTVSYLNAGDEKTLKSIKEIYTLVKQKASNSNNETKVEYKDITKEMPKNFEDLIS
jgi:hypothetical protein